MAIENISRSASSSSIPTLKTPAGNAEASSSKPALSRSTSTDSFVGPKPAPEAQLPKAAEEPKAATKSNWRTSLEAKINGGIAAVKSFGQTVKAKLFSGYEAGKDMLHEIGMFLATLGKTLMGIARPDASTEKTAAPATTTPLTTPPPSPKLAPVTDEKAEEKI